MILSYSCKVSAAISTTLQDIGISDLDVALIYSIIPFCIFLAPPLVGFVADKLGNYTRVIMIFMVLTGLFHTALLFVPPTITHVTRPNTAVTIRYPDPVA